jgi:hypothetical protein
MKARKSLVMKISSWVVSWLVIGSITVLAGEVFQINSLWPMKNSHSRSNHFPGDGRLKPGESKTVTVYANKAWNRTNIWVSEGMKYKFTVGSPEWNNGTKETTAAGYDSSSPRRHPDAKLMELVADLSLTEGGSAYTGMYVRIGMGRSSWTPPISGWLVAFANDCEPCYGDNSRVVTLTIKRIE